MSKGTPRTLRRVATPYIGQILILVGVTMLLFFVATKKQQWALLWSAGLIWVLFALYVFLFGLRYKVFWNDAGVEMHASGGPVRRVEFGEITGVRYESASGREYLSQARPFRRIVILGRRSDPRALIDISLRHFRNKDIENLLAAIRERRPDITLPTLPERS